MGYAFHPENRAFFIPEGVARGDVFGKWGHGLFLRKKLALEHPFGMCRNHQARDCFGGDDFHRLAP